MQPGPGRAAAVESAASGSGTAGEFLTGGPVPEFETGSGDLQLGALPAGRQLLYGLLMIVYRAETEIATVLADAAGQPGAVRALARSLVQSPASLRPEAQTGTLEVRLPHFPTRA